MLVIRHATPKSSSQRYSGRGLWAVRQAAGMYATRRYGGMRLVRFQRLRVLVPRRSRSLVYLRKRWHA